MSEVKFVADGDIKIAHGSRAWLLLQELSRAPLWPVQAPRFDGVVRCEKCGDPVGHFKGQTLVITASATLSGGAPVAVWNDIKPEVSKLSRQELEAEFQRVNRIRHAALQRAEEYSRKYEGTCAALKINEENGKAAIQLHEALGKERTRSAQLAASLAVAQGSLSAVQKQLQNVTEDRNQWRQEESNVATKKLQVEESLLRAQAKIDEQDTELGRVKQALDTALEQLSDSRRWEAAIRNMATFLVGPSVAFEVPQIVEMVRRLARCDGNGDPVEGSVRSFVPSSKVKEATHSWQIMARALRRDCKLNGYWHLPACEDIDAALRAAGYKADD